ncbi:ATP-dependent DNA helicase DDM1 isoform X2 [Helianthus annuus]|nr:ATP-dependent DNA helicase DDM1 isoform X2 [Helianthus annuus]XP_022012243.1 ATP-dependent DNA helicase DDM1 isoform X2 [Helianthus annuus]
MDLQAMDRCHKIGQTKPVHVYRLATALSFEGRMLKRAFSKLRLEHVVIGKRQFQQERIKNNEVLDEEDMLAHLRDDDNPEDKMVQTDISDEDEEKERLNGITVGLLAEKEKDKVDKDAMLDRMSQIEAMLKSTVRR